MSVLKRKAYFKEIMVKKTQTILVKEENLIHSVCSNPIRRLIQRYL